MPIRIFNTATRQKEELAPIEPGKVRFYNCGPTVYDHFHIGNARNFVVFDAARRHLRHRGFEVKYVQNLTDIDDKIINRANEEGVTSDEIAKRYTDYYFEKAGLLGVEPANVHPKATEHIPQIIALVERLIRRDLAYSTPSGDVYFRVRRFNQYGKLSGRDVNDLREGARVKPGEEKEDALDFALWKASKPGEPQWDSPWGKGRPGWHIECTAMIHTHLGETIDIHSGGCDLVFPHHENERAQSMGATGKEYVRCWMHNGFLNIDGLKMSKSLGNFRTIEDVFQEYSPLVVRFFLLSAHYRHPLDFSRENLNAAKAAVKRLRDCLTDVAQELELLGQPIGDAVPLDDFVARHDEAMDDDFNTAKAIGVLFDVINMINENRAQQTDNGLLTMRRGIATLIHLTSLLGLDPALDDATSVDTGDELRALAEELGATMPAETDEKNLIQALIDLRQTSRKSRDFATADAVRDRLAALGYILQDTPHGTTWKRGQ